MPPCSAASTIAPAPMESLSDSFTPSASCTAITSLRLPSSANVGTPGKGARTRLSASFGT